MWEVKTITNDTGGFLHDLVRHVSAYFKQPSSVYSIYYTNQMHIVSYVWVLNTQLRHGSVQANHLHGVQYARLEINCQWQVTVYTVPQSAVGSFVDVVYV
jgi:hypothetical protein